MNRFAFLSFLLLASPAIAHPGDHTHFEIMGLLAHIFETDHIVFALLAALTGVLAYRAGKRAGLRQKEAVSRRREPR